ncbi:MAG: glycoside hydrolase family 32 protein, partial [Muribaculaceae bacterium]|nr:glycoside hydrolase family 32 protein [Muribaculaceae bacterium]
MKKYFILSLVLGIAFSAAGAGDSLYRAPYRPQYHFTPAHRWIGDPCGTIKHRGRYMAYSWGGAVSDDLLHWQELNDHAIKGVPQHTATFTGSVVVDKNNTAGYGEDALIAAFTSFDEHSKKQSQSIAFSRDGGITYQYYDLNPVVDIWSTEFRDPTVIWDKDAGRWVMLVAKALEKKVVFYGSYDMKNWTWLSEFGPMGDNDRSWECPDMFRLPVEGTDERRWVLVVSVNWAREQYFVGEFDGTCFIPDSTDQAAQYVDDGLDYYASRVFQDYDNPDAGDVYTIGWVNTWDYATLAPSKWGKGIWSLPRKLSLYKGADGRLWMRQTPLKAIDSLRQKPVKMNRRP